MVVLMDPLEDPDDILRAHRSREKTYMFDVAFDYTATQVGLSVKPMWPIKSSIFQYFLHYNTGMYGIRADCNGRNLPVCYEQEEVYRATTKGLIEGLISGYNATVFAYGPTG